MEIRNVVNEVKNEYPKMKQVSKKDLSNSVPSKWLKIGLSSLGIAMIMKNNVFAESTIAVIAGGLRAAVPVPIRVCKVACHIIQVISAVALIITGLSILITKLKGKKQNEPKKVKKWIKVLFVISIILLIISVLTTFIINTIYY